VAAFDRRSEDPTRSRGAAWGPSIAIVASTFFWGTLWIPLRQLNEAGLGGSWATALGFAIPLAALLPVGVVRRRSLVNGGFPLVRAGALLAACIALYAEALLRGHVARVILLFYLTPVWSTLLARVLLGDRITRSRVVTIVLGLMGMFVVLGIGTALPVPRSDAEWMGLLSGLLWACSMVALRQVGREVSDVDKVFVQFLFLAPLFALVTALPGGRAWALPTPDVLVRSIWWLLVLGVVWMPSVLWLTMFGGSRLDPGRVAVLLMLEVVIGVGSAAVLAHEPFGARELLGAVLIVGACGSECVAYAPRVATRR